MVFLRSAFYSSKQKTQKASLASGCLLDSHCFPCFQISLFKKQQKVVSLVFPTVQRTKKKRHLSVFSIWCSPCCPCDISSDTSATSNTSTTSLSTSTIPRCDSLIFFLSNPSHGRKSQVRFATLASLLSNFSWNFCRAFSFQACFFLVTVFGFEKIWIFFLGVYNI